MVFRGVFLAKGKGFERGVCRFFGGEEDTPVSSYDRVTSLCRCSSVIEARMVFVYVNGGTDAALDAK